MKLCSQRKMLMTNFGKSADFKVWREPECWPTLKRPLYAAPLPGEARVTESNGRLHGANREAPLAHKARLHRPRWKRLAAALLAPSAYEDKHGRLHGANSLHYTVLWALPSTTSACTLTSPVRRSKAPSPSSPRKAPRRRCCSTAP